MHEYSLRQHDLECQLCSRVGAIRKLGRSTSSSLESVQQRQRLRIPGVRTARAHGPHFDETPRILSPMTPHPEDPPRTPANRRRPLAATLCLALRQYGASPVCLKGPAAYPPEHVACGTRRSIEILRRRDKGDDRKKRRGTVGSQRSGGRDKRTWMLRTQAFVFTCNVFGHHEVSVSSACGICRLAQAFFCRGIFSWLKIPIN